jgi:hypothetical protein
MQPSHEKPLWWRMVTALMLCASCLSLIWRYATLGNIVNENIAIGSSFPPHQQSVFPLKRRMSLANEVIDADQKVDLSEARQMLEKLLSLIFRRYELDSEHGRNFFRSSNNIDAHSWDIIKYKLAYKMALGNESFLMIFGGSSVTAGHDSFYNQSYPAIFHVRMEQIFSLMGVQLVVRNIALGANNCVPYILCYETMGGSDPDFVNWEQVSCQVIIDSICSNKMMEFVC